MSPFFLMFSCYPPYCPSLTLPCQAHATHHVSLCLRPQASFLCTILHNRNGFSVSLLKYILQEGTSASSFSLLDIHMVGRHSYYANSLHLTNKTDFNLYKPHPSLFHGQLGEQIIAPEGHICTYLKQIGHIRYDHTGNRGTNYAMRALSVQ